MSWLDTLKAEVERTSQARVAQRLGLSPGTVSQVLSGTYAADTFRIERRVRGELLGETCECPVMFDPSLRVCQDAQERPRHPGSTPQATQAWLACRGLGRFEKLGVCPHFNCGSKAAKTSKEGS